MVADSAHDCTVAVPVATERVDATVAERFDAAAAVERFDVVAEISVAFDSAAEFSSREFLPRRPARRQSASR